MRFLYLLSSDFPYEKLICRDAGPRFADDYGWGWCHLGEVERHAGGLDAVVVDPRFPPEELPRLDRFLQGFGGLVFLRISDPFESVMDHYWFRYLRERLDRPRLHVMLTYSPATATAFLMQEARRSRFVWAPYVYDARMELPVSHAGRRHKIMFSGALKRKLYPRRRAFHVARTWPPPLRGLSDHLVHPGYPDVNRSGLPSHGVIGDRYVHKLAEYRFAFVCSTVARIELLKYRELAYAGVAPLGDLPASLLDCPADAFLKWHGNGVSLSRQLPRFSAEESEAMALKYRAFIRERRDAARMQAWVAEQMAAL